MLKSVIPKYYDTDAIMINREMNENWFKSHLYSKRGGLASMWGQILFTFAQIGYCLHTVICYWYEVNSFGLNWITTENIERHNRKNPDFVHGKGSIMVFVKNKIIFKSDIRQIRNANQKAISTYVITSQGRECTDFPRTFYLLFRKYPLCSWLS